MTCEAVPPSAIRCPKARGEQADAIHRRPQGPPGYPSPGLHRSTTARRHREAWIRRPPHRRDGWNYGGGLDQGSQMTLRRAEHRVESRGWLRQLVWLAADCQHNPDPSPVGRRWRAAPDEGRTTEAAKPPSTGDPHPLTLRAALRVAQGRRRRRRALNPSPNGRGWGSVLERPSRHNRLGPELRTERIDGRLRLQGTGL